MKIKKLYITILFVMLWSFLEAQQYTNYTTKDGLPTNHIYTIVQDTKGFIWFLTDKGMVKYNGNEFKNFSTRQGLPKNDIWKAFVTPDSKVWYLAKSSKLGYIENDSVFVFPNENKEEIIYPLFSSQIRDTVYLSGGSKSYQLKNKKWKEIGAKQAKHNRYQIFHKEIAYLNLVPDTDTIEVYGKLKNRLKVLEVQEIYRVNGGRGQITDSLFYLISDKTYAFLNLNTLEFKQREFKTQIGLDVVQHVRINLVNDQLQISGTGFVGFLDAAFNIKDPFYFPEEIKSHFALIDKNHTVWLATFSNGIYKRPYIKRNYKYRLQNEKIKTLNIVGNQVIASVYNKGFYKYIPSEKEFYSLFKMKQYVYGAIEVPELDTQYFLSHHTIKTIKNNAITTIDYKKTTSLANSYAFQLVYFKGDLYGCSSLGIHKLNSETLEAEKNYMLFGFTGFLKMQNRLFLKTNVGLKEFSNDSIHSVDFDKEFDKPIISLCKVSDSEILMGTDGFGAYISDFKTLKLLPDSEFLTVVRVLIDETNIWLATNEGILKYVKKNKEYILEKQLTMSSGLPTNNINDIIILNEDLIVATDNGIAVLPKNQESVLQSSNIYIDEINYNNKSFSINNSIFQYEKNNTVNVSVASIDFVEGHANIIYDYKLEPVQKQWVNSKTKTINFNDLQPDIYTFHIRSNATKKTIQFRITPLWWQTLGFKISAILIVFTLFFFIVWYLSKQTQKKKDAQFMQEKQLSEIQLKALRSQMNPHFVFNSLSAIQYYINENDFEMSDIYLVKFSKLIRQFFELSKENNISLAVEINLLKSYLDIEKLRFREKLNYTITVDPKLNKETAKIPTMLLQPIVENAVNHGIFNKIENGQVTINFSEIDFQTFKVEILDDGVGVKNTLEKQIRKVQSSNVLKERLSFLNKSRRWKISYFRKELYPQKSDTGNITTFIIKRLKDE